MTDPVIYTFTVGDYENPIFLRGDDLLDELEVCNILNEHTALLAVVKAGIAYKDTLAKFGREPEGMYHVGDELLLDDWTETIAALPEYLK